MAVALGHLNKPVIIKLAQDSLPEEMIVTGVEHDLKTPCLECAVGKQSRSKQPKQDTSESAPTEEIGSAIVSDVAGKITPSHRYTNKYFVNYVDHASGFVMTYPMKRKSEQAAKAMQFLAEFETAFDVHVKVFRSDRGGEYLSDKFKQFLAKRGIRHQLTERATSASNGKAERMHRTLLNATRTMLFGCDLPPKFWSHALEYATYLRNRTPSKANAEMKSPLAILTDKQPSLAHAVPFGSTCTVRIEPRTKGIERRAEVGRILGVNVQTKSYNVWVARLGKVIVSTDITNIGKPRKRVLSDEENATLMEIDQGVIDGETTKRAEEAKKIRKRDQDRRLEIVQKDHERIAPEPRRSDRIHAMQLSKGGYMALVVTYVDPKTPKEALDGPNADKWREAMQLEVDNLIGNGTWELVDRPKDINIVSNKWVFNIKYDSAGEIEKFKARLVARGFLQRYGVDYTETFSPVIQQQSVRLLLMLGLHFDVDVAHVDVPQAYVKAGLDTNIYMAIPDMVPGDPETQALRLLKSLYGLKQSGRMWHADIDATLVQLGLQKSKPDPCVYYHWTEEGITLIGLYVDDIMTMSQD
ncbi:hypothetical protein Ae201684P_016080 [Aphanomyces euteiches]|uniref:Integrase catalytic domain-containing protein n=1 Tax=Aphanomyces euteiches TaxID=100861 RepID=A0A6G0WMJ0_9STRA|nr:hypothetical protein Ae201684_013709 [Aphanomyces euteiches]KAH9093451.1 hypothetical protein Ae201684P_016080 [Aphanomyces euteiches]KAH9157640.1 hypothetical protein AeRB84_000513 [Aphanomyces euteiches]